MPVSVPLPIAFAAVAALLGAVWLAFEMRHSPRRAPRPSFVNEVKPLEAIFIDDEPEYQPRRAPAPAAVYPVEALVANASEPVAPPPAPAAPAPAPTPAPAPSMIPEVESSVLRNLPPMPMPIFAPMPAAAPEPEPAPAPEPQPQLAAEPDVAVTVTPEPAAAALAPEVEMLADRVAALTDAITRLAEKFDARTTEAAPTVVIAPAPAPAPEPIVTRAPEPEVRVGAPATPVIFERPRRSEPAVVMAERKEAPAATDDVFAWPSDEDLERFRAQGRREDA